MDYFKNLEELLKIERSEDHLQYLSQTEKTSIAERRANGLTWYPIAIRSTEMVRGDYISVEVERTTHQDVAHQLRAGVPAIFFGNHEPQKDRVEGNITFVQGNRLKITLKTDELPDFARDGKLGIELLFDDNSYSEMFAALKTASKSIESSEHPTLRILSGLASPSFKDKSVEITSFLNPFQQNAIKKIVQANELAIVHGPPGTGKTSTLIEACQILLNEKSTKMLVVAPSNTAVDLLTEKLSDKGIEVIRIGNPSKITEKVIKRSLDYLISEHPQAKNIKNLKKQAGEYKNMAHKYKRNFGQSEREQRKLLFEEAHKLMKEVGSIEQYIIDDVLEKAQIITATPVGSNHFYLKNLKFDVAIIDEAGQALEPACWITALKAPKLILAGDHCQLPPTIKSKEAAKKGLEKTMLEKCVEWHPESVVLLEEQYRMNEQIMQHSSKIFYQNKLKASPKVAHQKLFELDTPMLFIDTAGCGFDEKTEGTSTSNPEEAAFVLKHLELYCSELAQKQIRPSIAIIAPYKSQAKYLEQLLLENTYLDSIKNRIQVNTVDSFQGQEREVVYISLTRSNTEGEIGFLADIRRMNVAMTRAKYKLVMIGDSATLSQFGFYDTLIQHCQETDSYCSAWEFLN